MTATPCLYAFARNGVVFDVHDVSTWERVTGTSGLDGGVDVVTISFGDMTEADRASALADRFGADVTIIACDAAARIDDVIVEGAIQAPPPPPPAPPASIPELIAYAEAKQISVLAGLEVSHAISGGADTLDTLAGPTSITFLNSLGTWVALNAAASPAPTRVYYNLDGSAHQVTPAQMAEFLAAVGAGVQAAFDTLAKTRSAIAARKITTKDEIDAVDWPTSIAS